MESAEDKDWEKNERDGKDGQTTLFQYCVVPSPCLPLHLRYRGREQMRLPSGFVIGDS